MLFDGFKCFARDCSYAGLTEYSIKRHKAAHTDAAHAAENAAVRWFRPVKIQTLGGCDNGQWVWVQPGLG